MVGIEIQKYRHIFLLKNSSGYSTLPDHSKDMWAKEVSISFWKIYVFRKLSHCDDKYYTQITLYQDESSQCPVSAIT
jgi:hypothetical protein